MYDWYGLTSRRYLSIDSHGVPQKKNMLDVLSVGSGASASSRAPFNDAGLLSGR